LLLAASATLRYLRCSRLLQDSDFPFVGLLSNSICLYFKGFPLLVYFPTLYLPLFQGLHPVGLLSNLCLYLRQGLLVNFPTFASICFKDSFCLTEDFCFASPRTFVLPHRGLSFCLTEDFRFASPEDFRFAAPEDFRVAAPEDFRFASPRTFVHRIPVANTLLGFLPRLIPPRFPA
jgi:hypothetical protein